MPVTSAWYDDDKTILFIKYDGNWTLDDYYTNFELANNMIRGVNHPVVTILDFSTSGPLPLRFLTVGSHAERTGAENIIQIIVFGITSYMESIARIFQRLFPKSLRTMQVVRSRAAAISLAQTLLNAEVSV